MNLEKIYKEEDLFPREITFCAEREYGFLFYNEDNKYSHDSNHALIFKNRISDLNGVLDDIVRFYTQKGIKPVIYQSVFDEGYFEDIKNILSEHGFECLSEEQKCMILSEPNTIKPNAELTVRKVSEWQEEYGTEIFESSDEAWAADIVKKALKNSNTLFFAAYYNGKPVGMTYGHIRDDVCRVDYLLVSAEYRNIGAGRALMGSFAEYCKASMIENCFLWPAGETAEIIYYEAGFRHAETKQAARAFYISGR